jgi:hypothetical protein
MKAWQQSGSLSTMCPQVLNRKYEKPSAQYGSVSADKAGIRRQSAPHVGHDAHAAGSIGLLLGVA